MFGMSDQSIVAGGMLVVIFGSFLILVGLIEICEYRKRKKLSRKLVA